MARSPVILLISICLFAACEDEKPCLCGNIGDQPVYFQYRHQNRAWGHQDRGWLIDGAGVIKGFAWPEDFRLPDSTGMIAYEDLVHNLQLTDTVLQRIPMEELNEYRALIPGAAKGTISEGRNIAADAGSSVLSAYLYDEEAVAYRYVFLAESGDWEQFNESPEAEQLVDWLVEYGVFWLSE